MSGICVHKSCITCWLIICEASRGQGQHKYRFESEHMKQHHRTASAHQLYTGGAYRNQVSTSIGIESALLPSAGGPSAF